MNHFHDTPLFRTQNHETLTTTEFFHGQANRPVRLILEPFSSCLPISQLATKQKHHVELRFRTIGNISTNPLVNRPAELPAALDPIGLRSIRRLSDQFLKTTHIETPFQKQPDEP